MATLPIYLEVEDVAVGPVMLALRRMSGIIKMKLDLEVGGASALPASRQHGGARVVGPVSNADMIKNRLVKANGDAVNVNTFHTELGIKKGSVYTALNHLKGQGLVTNAEGKGNWKLTAKAAREIQAENMAKGAVKMLPHPSMMNGRVPRGPAGRATPGSGWMLLRQRLDGGGATRATLMADLGAHGVSEKSVSGVIARAQGKKWISNATGQWELTAKGREQPAQLGAE